MDPQTFKRDDVVVTSKGHICKVLEVYPTQIAVFRARLGLPRVLYATSSLRLATLEDAREDYRATKNRESKRWIKAFAREIQREGITA